MKAAFVFSGQGAQYPGMFRDLYEQNEDARRVFDAASQALGRDLGALCFSGTAEDLNLTHNTQPCVLTADLAAAAALMGKGIRPAAVAGFSLGEYAALTVAGVLSEADVFPLIQLRADAMQRAVPVGEGGMAAVVGRTVEEVRALCREIEDDFVAPANENSPLQTVVSGTASGIAKFTALAEARGVMAVPLKVSAPFHCRLMQPAAEELKAALVQCRFGAPTMPVYMNYTGEVLAKAEDTAEMLYRQAFHPVLWADTVRRMAEDGVSLFVECGPGKTLSGLIKRTVKGAKVLHVESMATLEKAVAEWEALKE